MLVGLIWEVVTDVSRHTHSLEKSVTINQPRLCIIPEKRRLQMKDIIMLQQVVYETTALCGFKNDFSK
jgi:hypothetical protein